MVRSTNLFRALNPGGLLEWAGFRAIEFFACTEAGYERGVKPDRTHFEFGVIEEA